ncbi:MAG TPA: GNAT family N-acetyltransferase [Bdellovibrionota bacterium]|nr:GNAT family N-acetyltransferase [Bdellovibrionota bacterium]
MIRRRLEVPPRNGRLAIHIASTREELEGAFRLLHDLYVAQGLMKPHPSRFRCNIYQASPDTATIVALDGARAVGTVSVIKDSGLRFPSDDVYRRENNRYRDLGYRMCEISALAIHPEYRRRHATALGLMKYLFRYATHFMNCTMLCATVHPRALDFYRAVFNFRQNGKAVRYQFAENAPAIHISTDCLVLKDWMRNQFGRAPARRNLYQFIFKNDYPRMTFPNWRLGCTPDPVMTAELLEYFFVRNSEVFREASAEQLTFLKSAYQLYFDIEQIPYFNRTLPARTAPCHGHGLPFFTESPDPPDPKDPPRQIHQP